jgi:hypothetical protein
MIQNTPEWLAVRAGIVTASEANVLVTSKGDIAKGKGVETYLAKKAAERWLGRPLEGFAGTFAMDQGKVLEEDALPKFTLDTGLELDRVGFVTADDGSVGCSPDSLIMGSNVGLECKAPQDAKHVAYLLAGVCPDDYVGQVQCSMLVTGAPYWHFMSYCRGFPELIIRVERDERYIGVLRDAIELFNQRLEGAWKKLVALNGGEPVRLPPPAIRTIGDETTATMPGVDMDALDRFINSPEMNGN